MLNKDSIKERTSSINYNRWDDDKEDWYRIIPLRDNQYGRYSYNLINPKTKKEIFQNNWKISKEKYIELEKENKIYWSDKYPYKKFYLNENKGVIPNNLIDNIFNSTGTNQLNNVIGINNFSHPKPLELISKFIKLYHNQDAIILDFFAGSGTTGQAVIELNQEDGGNRQFILCTNNENNICEEITYERLRTVITGIRKDGSKYSDGIPTNLKYYKCEWKERE